MKKTDNYVSLHFLTSLTGQDRCDVNCSLAGDN